MTRIRKRRFLVVSALFFLGAVFAWAEAPDDGFGSAGTVEGKHFTVYFSPKTDPAILAQALNVTPSDKLLAGKSMASEASSEDELAQAVDVLFALVCNTLDMQLYSYKGRIKVCLDEKQLLDIYRNLFGQDAQVEHAHSFYVYDVNTIYITRESFTRVILGHEIGHAVIGNYFVVQPPVKVQEVLAGYVEYQLRKAAP